MTKTERARLLTAIKLATRTYEKSLGTNGKVELTKKEKEVLAVLNKSFQAGFEPVRRDMTMLINSLMGFNLPVPAAHGAGVIPAIPKLVALVPTMVYGGHNYPLHEAVINDREQVPTGLVMRYGVRGNALGGAGAAAGLRTANNDEIDLLSDTQLEALQVIFV